MATKTTDSRDWVYLDKYYSLFSSSIRVFNFTTGNAKVQFRALLNSEESLPAPSCINYSVVGYAEVWIKSADGQPVTVTSSFGSCSGATATDEEYIFNEETVTEEVKNQILDSMEKLSNQIRS